MGDRPHRFSANGTQPKSCVRCHNPREHPNHPKRLPRPPLIRWKRIFNNPDHAVFSR